MKSSKFIFIQYLALIILSLASTSSICQTPSLKEQINLGAKGCTELFSPSSKLFIDLEKLYTENHEAIEEGRWDHLATRNDFVSKIVIEKPTFYEPLLFEVIDDTRIFQGLHRPNLLDDKQTDDIEKIIEEDRRASPLFEELITSGLSVKSNYSVKGSAITLGIVRPTTKVEALIFGKTCRVMQSDSDVMICGELNSIGDLFSCNILIRVPNA